MAAEFRLKLKEIIIRNYNVKSFRLEFPLGTDFKAGQFMRVVLKEEPGFMKYLSISSSPTEKGYIEFTKKITESDFSKSLNALRPSDEIKIQYPFGSFTLEKATAKITFLCGGIGITPVRSICKYAVDKSLRTDIVLVYANRSIKDIVFKEDFDLMQGQFPGLKIVHVLAEPAAGFKCTPGLINALVVKNEMPDYRFRKFYICGPLLFVQAMGKMLMEELSLAETNIVTENFIGY